MQHVYGLMDECDAEVGSLLIIHTLDRLGIVLLTISHRDFCVFSFFIGRKLLSLQAESYIHSTTNISLLYYEHNNMSISGEKSP